MPRRRQGHVYDRIMARWIADFSEVGDWRGHFANDPDFAPGILTTAATAPAPERARGSYSVTLPDGILVESVGQPEPKEAAKEEPASASDELLTYEQARVLGEGSGLFACRRSQDRSLRRGQRTNGPGR
jgi:hypothetical protein